MSEYFDFSLIYFLAFWLAQSAFYPFEPCFLRERQLGRDKITLIKQDPNTCYETQRHRRSFSLPRKCKRSRAHQHEIMWLTFQFHRLIKQLIGFLQRHIFKVEYLFIYSFRSNRLAHHQCQVILQFSIIKNTVKNYHSETKWQSA